MSLRSLVEAHVCAGAVPGAVALVARRDRDEVVTVGHADAGKASALHRDAIFRIASVTKPIIAAAVLMLVEDRRVGLDEPVARWLPELTSPRVLRVPTAPVDDVVSIERPITPRDLLSFRSGYGFPTDFSSPIVDLLVNELKQGPPRPQLIPEPREWMDTLSRIPLLHQPGQGWLYNTSSDILGVLAARACGQDLPTLLADRVFEPLGMTDTGFEVPSDKHDRVPPYYRVGTAGGWELVDVPDGQWSSMPAFPSGAAGLVSTVDDLWSFARMLLGEGVVDGRRLLSSTSVRRMMTNHLSEQQRNAGRMFLEGQGWGFGGSVDVHQAEPWNVPGRYGWVGGTGTAAHVTPSTGTVTIVLSQVEMTGPATPAWMRDVWRYAAD